MAIKQIIIFLNIKLDLQSERYLRLQQTEGLLYKEQYLTLDLN